MTKRKPDAVPGRPRELPTDQRSVNVRIAKEDLDGLRWHAFVRDTRVSVVIRDAIVEYLRKHPAPKNPKNSPKA